MLDCASREKFCLENMDRNISAISVPLAQLCFHSTLLGEAALCPLNHLKRLLRGTKLDQRWVLLVTCFFHTKQGTYMCMGGCDPGPAKEGPSVREYSR
jgi:hypothetical protein